MNYWLIILISIIYLGLLSLVAYFADKRAKTGKAIQGNPYVYALSLAVYCTAWTYYGSVGKAASDGLSFLAIYLGPIIGMPLWLFLITRIVKISNALRINTLADFIATRFGKSTTLSVLVTIMCILGVVPYVSIQLKAIDSSIKVLSPDADQILLFDSAFLVVILLTAFILVFTFRTVDSTKKHHGLVSAIALESVVKLIAFLLVGGFITYGMFDGFGDIFNRVSDENLGKYSTLEGSSYPVLLFLSFSAVFFLPRQFHVTIAENTTPQNIKTAIWLFPAYLLAINLFVIPVAIGGEYLLSGNVDPDMYLIELPLLAGNQVWAMITYIGGFSAATGMIIVSTIAISMMASNNLVIPLIIKGYNPSKINERKALLIRRISVVVVLFGSYLYFEFVSNEFPLVAIGLISFAAVAQFTPVVLASLFWKEVTRQGAIFSLLAGFAIWFYTLVVPGMVKVGLLPLELVSSGPFGIEWLNPTSLFGIQLTDPIVHGTFWSLFFNVGFLILGTLFYDQSGKERNFADFYTEYYKYQDQSNRLVWKGTMIQRDLKRVMENILGKGIATLEINSFKKATGISLDENDEVNPQFVTHAEKLLTGAIGASSARMLIASISKEEDIELSDVVALLREKKEISKLNELLSSKSKELKKQADELESANSRLQNLDVEKDDFISTVTHEMRTPLTSIRAMTEIIHDNPDLTDEERKRFLATVVDETERMTRLINQVLDLEKLESGQLDFNMERLDICELTREVIESFEGQLKSRDLKVDLKCGDVYFINGDYDRLTQVLNNLISNAIKYSSDSSIIEVLVEGRQNVMVSVTDHGKGIEAENIDRIFDKFFQARDQTRKKPKGTGLGLSITKRIVNMHEGEIWVKSEVGNGSTFIFTLPRFKEELETINE